MTATDVAARHYTGRQRLERAVAAEAARLWGQVDPADLNSWSVSRLMVVLAGAQALAAEQADAYVGAALAEQGIEVAAAGAVVADAFSGVASDGRPLETLLRSPVIAAKQAIAQGADTPRAMAGGRATLDMIVRTQVADAGRVADGVAVAARPGTGYVRMTRGKTCARCTILAGRFYRYNQGFRRHPRCDCVHIPASENTSNDVRTNPRAAFDAGEVRGLTKVQEQAIRDGADMAQVVNANRGMATASVAGRQIRVTTEGTTRRGLAYRGRGTVRLMPEEIYRQADSRADTIRLLRLHGYIL